MELVEGVSLSRALAQLARLDEPRLRGADLLRVVAQASGVEPTAAESTAPPYGGGWFEACAWIAREVAQALEHAHQRGVVHRDVKPSNVMLTSSGRVLLLDFGLASAEGADALTRSSSPQGSLPYMAPEQVRGEGEAIGPATDVYALGVLLYEMLSLRRPFVAREENGLLRAILDARPAPLRAVIAAVPRDLAAAVAVAMAPEPARRYASAADFARDLSHVLAGEPIEARPAGAWSQLVRWVRRNPAAAALAILVLFVGPTLFAVQQHWAAARILEQRRRADESLGRAREAIDYIVQIGWDTLRRAPALEDQSLAALSKSVDFLESTIALEPQDLELRQTLCKTLVQVATVQRRHGRLREAAASSRKAIAGLTVLAEGRAFDDPATLEVARARANLSHTLAQLRELPEALALIDAACETYERHAAAHPDDPLALRSLAWAQWQQGLTRQAAGDLAGAERSLRDALALERRLLAGVAGYVYDAARVADTMLGLGSVQREAGRATEAEACVREALALMTSRFPAKPSDDFRSSQFARSHEELGLVLIDLGRGAQAEAELREAIQLWSEIAGTFELVPEFAARRAATHLELGALLARAGRTDEAAEHLRVAEGHATRLRESFPDAPAHAELAARAGAELARLPVSR
jgi:tetratricopeptide (TPR) repeat protein